jgi:hypothetical protein
MVSLLFMKEKSKLELIEQSRPSNRPPTVCEHGYLARKGLRIYVDGSILAYSRFTLETADQHATCIETKEIIDYRDRRSSSSAADAPPR